MEEDVLLSEYKRRIEKIKTEEELEKIKLDEIKELKKKVFVEYEENKSELEKLKSESDKLSKSLRETVEKKKQIEEDMKQKQDFIIQLEDGTFEIAGKDDVEIVSQEDIIKNVNKQRE